MKRTLIKAGLGLLALALLLAAWPLFSAWQLRQAVRTRNVAALESKVDWTTLRANMKPRIMQAVRENAEQSTGITGVLKRAVSGTVADKSVDWLVTPKNLSRVLAGREFYARRIQKSPPVGVPPQPAPKDAKAPPVDDNDPAADDLEDPEDPMPPRRIRWAFFESPTRFRIEAVHPRIPKARIVSILGQQGLGWKLIDVQLVER